MPTEYRHLGQTQSNNTYLDSDRWCSGGALNDINSSPLMTVSMLEIWQILAISRMVHWQMSACNGDGPSMISIPRSDLIM